MAKVVVGAELKIENLDKAGQSVGNFRKELKQAQNDVVTLSDKFGLASKEAQAAAKRVAEMKDRIGDAKSLVETFNPDKKFVALGGAVQGVVSGFSAFTGVMGLFGEKSKEVEEVLLKVQSAMALQQGLSGLKASIDSFKLLGQAIQASTAFQKANNVTTMIAVGIQRLFGVSVTGTGVAFNRLKAAIVATGIGALVVLLGVAANAMGVFSDETEDAAEAQKKLREETERQKDALDDIMAASQQYIDRQIDIIKNNERIADLQAKGAGNERAIANIRKENIALELQNVRVELSSKAGLLTTQEELNLKTKEYQLIKQGERVDIELATKAREKANELAAKEKQLLEERKQIEEKLLGMKRERLANEIKAIEDYGAQLAEADQAIADAEIQRLRDNEQRRLETKAELAELAILDDPDSIENKIAKINADLELELFALAEGDLRRQILAKQASDAVVQIKKEEVEAKNKLQQLEVQQVNAGVNAIANALDGFAEVAGRQSAAGKALSIAVTVIKTIQGGISAFMGMVQQIPGPVGIALGAVAAAGVVASGYASIAKMKAVQIPGKGGSSGGGTPTAPTAPIIPRPQTTTLDQQSINQVGNAAARSYVLETDVSSNQERIRRLNRAARIN